MARRLDGRGFPCYNYSWIFMNETPASDPVVRRRRGRGSMAEEVADTRLFSKQEVIVMIESLTTGFLQAISRGEDPELFLVSTAAP